MYLLVLLFTFVYGISSCCVFSVPLIQRKINFLLKNYFKEIHILIKGDFGHK